MAGHVRLTRGGSRGQGTEGFKNCRKGTTVAAQATGLAMASRLHKAGITSIRVCVKGLGPGRMVRALLLLTRESPSPSLSLSPSLADRQRVAVAARLWIGATGGSEGAGDWGSECDLDHRRHSLLRPPVQASSRAIHLVNQGSKGLRGRVWTGKRVSRGATGNREQHEN